MTIPYQPITKESAAELLAVSKRTIDNWIADGTIIAPLLLADAFTGTPMRSFNGSMKNWTQTAPRRPCWSNRLSVGALALPILAVQSLHDVISNRSGRILVSILSLGLPDWPSLARPLRTSSHCHISGRCQLLNCPWG